MVRTGLSLGEALDAEIVVVAGRVCASDSDLQLQQMFVSAMRKVWRAGHLGMRRGADAGHIVIKSNKVNKTHTVEVMSTEQISQ